MSKIKGLIEDVAEEVVNYIEKNKCDYHTALVNVLAARGIKDGYEIAVYDEAIKPYVI